MSFACWYHRGQCSLVDSPYWIVDAHPCWIRIKADIPCIYMLCVQQCSLCVCIPLTFRIEPERIDAMRFIRWWLCVWCVPSMQQKPIPIMTTIVRQSLKSRVFVCECVRERFVLGRKHLIDTLFARIFLVWLRENGMRWNSVRSKRSIKIAQCNARGRLGFSHEPMALRAVSPTEILIHMNTHSHKHARLFAQRSLNWYNFFTWCTCI